MADSFDGESGRSRFAAGLNRFLDAVAMTRARLLLSPIAQPASEHPGPTRPRRHNAMPGAHNRLSIAEAAWSRCAWLHPPVRAYLFTGRSPTLCRNEAGLPVPRGLTGMERRTSLRGPASPAGGRGRPGRPGGRSAGSKLSASGLRFRSAAENVPRVRTQHCSSTREFGEGGRTTRRPGTRSAGMARDARRHAALCLGRPARRLPAAEDPAGR